MTTLHLPQPRRLRLPRWWPSGAHVSRVSLALSTLALVGASLGLCFAFFALPDPATFLLANKAPSGIRSLMLASMLGAAVVVTFPAFMLVLLGGIRGLDTVDRAARLTAPLILAAFLPALF